MILIITLFKSQIFLAEHRCSTNWGYCKSTQLKSNQIKSNVGFWGEGKTGVPGEKTSRSRVANQQTQPTYNAKSGNQTISDTLAEGERSHHCANPAPPVFKVKIIVLTSHVHQTRNNLEMSQDDKHVWLSHIKWPQYLTTISFLFTLFAFHFWPNHICCYLHFRCITLYN